MCHYNILIADDDIAIIKLLLASLRYEGWIAFTAMDGKEAIQIATRESLDLIILDLNLPKINGFDVLRQLREWSQIPIIVLSGRVATTDKVGCLNLGADDYITKPFGVDELIARIKAVLRRQKDADYIINTPSSFTSGNLKIDFTKRRVTIADYEVKFTPTEYNLLRTLVLNNEKVLTYAYLLSKIWGSEYNQERQYLHIFVSQIRAKIEPDPKHPKYIINIAGVGYRFQSG
jgi:two-component system KDP operon response regulator KdpE